ncbi:MAG: hypothetical protein J6P77_03550, partial [Acetobacter sp.]|nr:hypothetical protein [Acetobacter sp.]
TEKVVEQLKQLWADDLSTAEIGRRLNMTKNAVVGKAHRLGLSSRPSPIQKTTEAKPLTPTTPQKTTISEKTQAIQHNTMTKSNPLIPFLASYGPTSSSNTMYDECVIKAAKDYGCTPLDIEIPLIDDIVTMLQKPSPKSVILTGTAGDGKTYTVRKIVEKLSNNNNTLTNEKTYHFPHSLPSSRRPLYIIKDLSELDNKDKKSIFSKLCNALTQHDDDVPVFIICANDGCLLQFFKDYAPLYDKIINLISNNQDNKEEPQTCFWLINMARQPRQNILDQVIDKIVEHPQWDKCPPICPAYTNNKSEKRCPILCNRDILQQKGDNSMRARLRDIVCLAELSEEHLPIRQIIIGIINILLGDHKPNSSLLTCKKAQNRADKNEYSLTNPYANAFGDNLPQREQKRYKIFTILNDFQIGFESNNFFEYALLWGNEKLPDCFYYGSRIFEKSRQQYLRDPTTEHAEYFLHDMIVQRRRLFFSLAPNNENCHANPWQLSRFKYGAEYLDLFNELFKSNTRTTPKKSDKFKSIARQVLCGLNRVMTQTMTATNSELWITTSSSVYRGNPTPLLIQRAQQRADSQSVLSFTSLNNTLKTPVIRVTQKDHSIDLVLKPFLFECLLRIAHGALPASFLLNIHQDIEKFQRQVTAITQKNFDHIPPKEVQLSSSGELQERAITILKEEEDF